MLKSSVKKKSFLEILKIFLPQTFGVREVWADEETEN